MMGRWRSGEVSGVIITDHENSGASFTGSVLRPSVALERRSRRFWLLLHIVKSYRSP